MTFQNKVYVVGAGITKFEKPGKHPDVYFYHLAKEAVNKALEDALLRYSDVEQACVGFVNGESASGQRALYEVGMTGIPIMNVNNNCATGSTALYMASKFIQSGENDCVLALGFDIMENGPLKPKFKNQDHPVFKHIQIMKDLVGINRSPLAVQIHGHAAIEHMAKFGTKPEHFAKIAYKNHKHSVNNPNAQFQKEYTLEEILNSQHIFGPLTKLQCCSSSNGSAAVILASENFVHSRGLEKQAVEILGIEMATDTKSTFEDRSCISVIGHNMTKLAAEKLFQKTKYKPTDVDVIELHDCFSSSELLTYEALGLCAPGRGADLVEAGDNTYGGKYVINPSGGLISRGHPLGATGIAQCVELCWQLRGEAEKRQVIGAKLALQQNLGLGGAVVVAIYKMGFPDKLNFVNSKRLETKKKILSKL